MKATVQSITNFMDGKNTHFSIPVYQRNYDWSSKDQCKILWEDLCTLASQQDELPHFFGTIVSVRNHATDDLIIIDGQQRLTTVSILLLAILNRIKEFKQFNPDLEFPSEKEIENLCLDFKSKQKLKLKLLRGDMLAYECVAAGRVCDNYTKNKVYQNYKYFYSLLTKDNINEIYNACHKLQVVCILLTDQDDNPQSVFESLNAKGLKLSDADKIRNYILMDFDYETQERLYTEYWEPMELNAGSGIYPDATTTYIWRFMAYKNNQKTSEKDTYTLFKKYKQDVRLSVENLLKEMWRVSFVYRDIQIKQIKQPNTDNLSKKINAKLSVFFDMLKQTTLIPLLIDIIDNYYKEKISENEVVEILQVLESYLIRRGITRMPTSTLNAFLLMNVKVNKFLASEPNATYVDVIKHIIYSANNRDACPDDEQVRTNLLGTGLYNNNKQLCRHILESLEKNHSKDCTLTMGDLTIEHIMPQTLNQEWIEHLGPDYNNIHSKYLHTLGNLTLTGYNVPYSNYSFRQKKRLSNGFDYSPLYLNDYMKTVDVWGENQICERANKLSNDCLNIWPIIRPVNIYKQQTQDIKTVALDNTDIVDIIKGGKPKSATLGDNNIDGLNSWKSLYINLINVLFSMPEYNGKMQQAFSYGNQGKFENIIAQTEVNRGEKGEIFWEQIIPDNSTYFRINKSAGDFIKAIKIWFDYLGIEESDLLIYLK